MNGATIHELGMTDTGDGSKCKVDTGLRRSRFLGAMCVCVLKPLESHGFVQKWCTPKAGVFPVHNGYYNIVSKYHHLKTYPYSPHMRLYLAPNAKLMVSQRLDDEAI